MVKTKKLKLGFLTTVSGRWPRELPNERLVTYNNWLRETYPEFDIVSFDTIVDSTERIEDAIATFTKEGVDVVLQLYGAFTGDDVCTAIADALNVPIILWALPEPDLKGGRLLANALVAMTMNSASLHRLGHTSYSILGGKEDQDAMKRLDNILKAYAIVKQMKGTIIGLFGYRPTAFYNSAFDEGLIRKTFGIRMEETDLKTVFDRMEQIAPEMIAEDYKKLEESFILDQNNPKEHFENHSRLYFALKELVKEQGYDYSAIKCWPEMGNLKTTPCAVLGRLADDGISIACEGDIDATLALIAQNYLTNKPNFITDMIDINEEKNYLTFWHCGNAAPSLHHPAKKATLGNHPLAGQGTAFRTPLKEGPVTVSRFCNIDGVYKLFIIRGTAVATDMYTPGSMINVQTTSKVKDIVYGIIEKGVPHHYSIVWEDVADYMIEVAKVLGLEVIEY